MAAHRRLPAHRRRTRFTDGRRRLPAALPRGRCAMTATGGGPALDGAAGGAVRRGAPRLRTVLALAKVEASLLIRGLLVLAGLLAGGAVIWLFIRSVQPLWWNAAWEIGEGQLVLAMAVLVAAQLAAGRARRDAMSDLYASFPATAGTRTLA